MGSFTISKASDDLLAFLRDLGIQAATSEHAYVRTVEESRDLRGDIPGVHTKNLFLRDAKRRYYLVVADEQAKIDLKKLAGKIGANGKLSFASPAVLQEILGVEAGAVSLLAAVNDKEKKATVVLDEALLAAPVINCHPLKSNRTTSLSRNDIEIFLAATGHRLLHVRIADADIA
jgi:Ala-tRNA(Pro) deacylase